MKATNRLSALFVFVIMLAALAGCASTATQEGTGGYVDDSVVTTKVKAALLDKLGAPSTQITVETFKGVVKLSGFVGSQEMITEAQQAAQSVKGVQSVENDLTVKGQQGSE
ncbi:MAG: BON domain-containing protein [Gammaproteobacteria bacterium]